MKPSYTVTTNRQKGMLTLTLCGFFDLKTVDEFAKARDAAVDSLGCGLNAHVTLCDIRSQLISSPDILEELRGIISDPRYASKKLAFVVTAALSKRQTSRIVNRDRVAYFSDIASAEKWLNYDEDTSPIPTPT